HDWNTCAGASRWRAPPVPSNPPLALAVDSDSLKALVRAVVAEVISELEQARQQIPEGRLAYSEPEAAAMLGLQPHVLRDLRLRGEIRASQVVGRRIRYVREDLVAYLQNCRVNN